MKKKVRTCERCGAELPAARRKRLCLDCSLEDMRESIRQLRQKEGPVYDKWRANLKESLEARSHEPVR